LVLYWPGGESITDTSSTGAGQSKKESAKLIHFGDQAFTRLVLPFLDARDSLGLAVALRDHFDNPRLVDLLHHHHTDTAKLAVVCLGLTGSMQDYPALVAALQHEDPAIVHFCEHTLATISSRAGTQHQNFLLRRAAQLVHENDRDEAMLLLNRVLVENPDFAEAYYQRALLADLNGDLQSAEQDARHALELNPLHHDAHRQLGHTLMQLGRYDEALDCIYRALEIHPRLDGTDRTIRTLRRLAAGPRITHSQN